MAKENNSKNVSTQTPVNNVVPVVMPTKEEYIVCDMCGHVNTIKTSICIKCSNYLTKEGK